MMEAEEQPEPQTTLEEARHFMDNYGGISRMARSYTKLLREKEREAGRADEADTKRVEQRRAIADTLISAARDIERGGTYFQFNQQLLDDFFIQDPDKARVRLTLTYLPDRREK